MNGQDYTPVHTSTAQLLHTGLLKHRRPEAASLQSAPSPPPPHLPLLTPRAGMQQLPGQSPSPPSAHGAGHTGWMCPAALGEYRGNLQSCCCGIRGSSRGQLCRCKRKPRRSPRTRQWVGAAPAPRGHLGWPRHLVPWELSPAGHIQEQVTAPLPLAPPVPALAARGATSHLPQAAAGPLPILPAMGHEGWSRLRSWPCFGAAESPRSHMQ